MSTWPLIAALVIYAAWFVINEYWRIAPFRRRHDHRRLWLAAIPSCDTKRVEDLLSLICEAFMIPQHYRFRLSPSDDVHTFYHRNMRGQIGDSLEYVHLMRGLEDFGVAVEHVVTERPCTVGALVRCITRPRGKRTGETTALVGDAGTRVGHAIVTDEPPSVG